jgi:hypothetical protein
MSQTQLFDIEFIMFLLPAKLAPPLGFSLLVNDNSISLGAYARD